MNRGAVRRFLQRSDGAAAIEFALIAPVALILLAGLVNVGLQVREQAKLNQATREVAEAAMFTRNLTVLRQVLDNALAENGIAAGGPRQVRLICVCPGQAEIANCSLAQARSCTATGLPWEIVIEVSAGTQYQPPIGGSPVDLQSRMRVQMR
jgi:Flp pilus assembly pilin Flp